MELTLNRPFVLEFEDRTRSSRPPREALRPAAEPASLVARLVGLAPFEVETALPAREVLPLLAFWGD